MTLQLELDFAAADATRDDQPFGDWVRSLPPPPWAYPTRRDDTTGRDDE